MSKDLLQLPFEIQAVLAIGYLAYRLATTGLDKHHRTGDFVLQVLVYGAVAKVVQEVVADLGAGYWPSFGVALAFTLGAAACWRAFAQRWATAMLRSLRVTRENYNPSTWHSIINARHPWRYVSVQLDDGTWLDSNIDALPLGLPHDPLDVDMDGNVAMYVTQHTDSDGSTTPFDTKGVLDDYGRAHLTYIPAGRIRRLTVSIGTRRSPATSSAVAGEAPDDQFPAEG